MKSIYIILFSLFTSFSFGQTDTNSNVQQWNEEISINSQGNRQVLKRSITNENIVIKTVYYKSGQIQEISSYKDYSVFKLDGKLQMWYENAQLKRDIDYKDGKLDGKCLTYWKDGSAKRIDSLVNGKLISGKCYNQDGSESEYYDYEIMPEFPGGENSFTKFIIDNIQFPKKPIKKGISGMVYVQFVINKDGSISDVKILRSVNLEYDNEAIRLVKSMPRWHPGYEDGDAIRVAYVLPINFTL